MDYLGKADFERFGWFHPDDCDFDYEANENLVFCSVQHDGIYHFVLLYCIPICNIERCNLIGICKMAHTG